MYDTMSIWSLTTPSQSVVNSRKNNNKWSCPYCTHEGKTNLQLVLGFVRPHRLVSLCFVALVNCVLRTRLRLYQHENPLPRTVLLEWRGNSLRHARS